MAQATDPPAATPDPRGERALLASYRRGDRQAAEILVERTYRQVWGALYRFAGGNEELAADLTQETYRRAWQALPRFEGRSSVSTWLYRIAYTTYLNHLRRPRPVVSIDDEQGPEPADPDPGPHRLAESAADQRRLRSAVLRLDEPLRFTVSARFWGGHSVPEIARQEGISAVAVRKRLRKALGQLEQSLREETR